jgi:hypothetical protein
LTSDPSDADLSSGDDARITVRITGDSNTPFGPCELWIRYAVEVNGPDKVKLRVFDRGLPTSVTVTPSFPKAGESMRVTFTGTGLANASFKITDFPALNHAYQERDRSETQYSFTCEPIFAGGYIFDGNQLVDRGLPRELRDLDPAHYQAQALGVLVRPNPIVTSVGRPVSTVGQSLSLEGATYRGRVGTLPVRGSSTCSTARRVSTRC